MSIISTILGSGTVSQVCNAITLAEVSANMAKNIPKRKKILNWLKPSLKIAVFGSSGSGKSSFLGSLKGAYYNGESSRYTETVTYRLPNGRRLIFYDCPCQPSYRGERTQIKSEILKGKFHAIINVVCFGYNETDTMKIDDIFDKNWEVRAQFLEENKKIELEQLKEWIEDIYSTSKIKWLLTLINKEDLWKDNIENVISYYQNGAYHQIIVGIEKACKLHVNSYCSKMALFRGRTTRNNFSEKDKLERHRELIESISQYISKS